MACGTLCRWLGVCREQWQGGQSLHFCGYVVGFDVDVVSSGVVDCLYSDDEIQKRRRRVQDCLSGGLAVAVLPARRAFRVVAARRILL